MSLMVVLSLFIQILYLFDQTQCQFSLFLLHTNSSFIQLDLVVLLSASSSYEFFNNFLIIIANINKSLNEFNGSSLSFFLFLIRILHLFDQTQFSLSLFFIRILYSFDQIQYYCSLFLLFIRIYSIRLSAGSLSFSLLHTNSLFDQTQCYFSLSLPRTNSLFVLSIRRKYNDR